MRRIPAIGRHKCPRLLLAGGPVLVARMGLRQEQGLAPGAPRI